MRKLRRSPKPNEANNSLASTARPFRYRVSSTATLALGTVIGNRLPNEPKNSHAISEMLFAGALATTQTGRSGGPFRSRAGGPKSRKGRLRLFGSTLPVPVRTAVFRRRPRQDVGNRICNESRSSSAPLPESEHDGKEKSCQSSKYSLRNRKAVECAQALACQKESCIRHRDRPYHRTNPHQRPAISVEFTTSITNASCCGNIPLGQFCASSKDLFFLLFPRSAAPCAHAPRSHDAAFTKRTQELS